MPNDPEASWRPAFEEQLDDDARDVLVALLSCDGWIGIEHLHEAASAFVAARGRVLAAPAFDAAVDVLAGSFCRSVPNGATVLLAVADPPVKDVVERWLAERLPTLRALVGSAAFFDQARWARSFVYDVPGGVALLPDVFAAARRTWDTRAVRWQPRTGKARRSAPAYLPPRRDVMARLGLVGSLLDRDDAEARDWVVGLLPRTRQDWADQDRLSVVEALPALADLLPDGAAALVAQALAGDERHGFGWTHLGALCVTSHGVFPDDVWDDVRKRFLRWARRRLTYPLDDAAHDEVATVAEQLGLDFRDELAAAKTT